MFKKLILSILLSEDNERQLNFKNSILRCIIFSVVSHNGQNLLHRRVQQKRFFCCVGYNGSFAV
jgi:hypothetical protein